MSKFYLFLSIVFLYVLIFWLNKTFILPESKLIELLSKNYSNELINGYLDYQRKWKWLNYVMIPIVYIVKIFLVAFCLNFIKLFFLPGLEKIQFSDLVFIVMIAEFVFIIAGFFKFINFYWIDTGYSLEEVQTYYPISLVNMRDYISTEKWLNYPLQLVNIFEFFYWGVLGWGIWELSDKKISFLKAFGLVAVTYGVALLFWVGIVSFLILNSQY
ncbi:hypothetical protein CHRY9393_03394 [Chryseobacterium fistulae]|uniref:Yip1 domain-containing protein n=1 Tax=Chryseobacterium fistulae TaxID=2675058 RepID=A0A6N4XWD0_9FLAO|nr:hypothetical protein CHRY9393_03394 [Chryseobacterium fistulae]